MFDKNIYIERRKILKKFVKTGLILLLGNEESPANFRNNKFPFRQDSTFLYYFGLAIPGMAAVIDVDEGSTTLFRPVLSRRERQWDGPGMENEEMTRRTGVTDIRDVKSLYAFIWGEKTSGACIHYLPTYNETNERKLSKLMYLKPSRLLPVSSKILIQAVLSQRLRKDDLEVGEIRKAVKATGSVLKKVESMIKPGISEQEILCAIEGNARLLGYRMASAPIVTVQGQYLHNKEYSNVLKPGDTLLIDFGVETVEGYCSDITRCYPVSGQFTGIEKELYQLVYTAQQKSIAELKSDVPFASAYMKSAEVLVKGLLDLGILKGGLDEIMEERAFYLFYPHGLSHMMGLDQHDLEGVFKEYCSRMRMDNFYDEEEFNIVRMHSHIQSGNILTVEPGLYFNKAEIEEWRGRSHLARFINYQQIDKLNLETGFRIEDDILITDTGCEVLSRAIPKHGF